MDRYLYHEYTILLGATRALAHIGVYFIHRVFRLSTTFGAVTLKISNGEEFKVNGQRLKQYLGRNIIDS